VIPRFGESAACRLKRAAKHPSRPRISKKTELIVSHHTKETTPMTPTTAWRSTSDGDVLERDGRVVAHLRQSTDLPGLWKITRPKVVGGEHDRLTARILASRLCRLTPQDFVGDAA
jgi:hypothetical protein